MSYAAKSLPSNARVIKERAISRVLETCSATHRPRTMFYDLDKPGSLPLNSREADAARFARVWSNASADVPSTALTSEQSRDIEGVRRLLGADAAQRAQASLGQAHIPLPDDRLFDTGTVGLSLALTKIIPAAREVAVPLIERHVQGNFGLHGKYEPADDDAKFCPVMFSQATRNSVAIEGDAETVLVMSAYSHTDAERRTHEIRILTDLQSGRTLVLFGAETSGI